MALTKQKKNEVIDEVSKLIDTSKLTVAAKYAGTTVKAMQELRRSSKANGTTVKVIKNRLVIQALKNNPKFKDVDTSALNQMLVYAFNPEDEVAPAQALNAFAKNNPNLEFVGAYTMDGQFLGAEDVKALANLPSKDQLRSMLVGTFAAPLSGFVNVLAGNVRGFLNVLNAREESLNN
ncbi:MAG: 50S ribosomal protein L10 [bacterium]|jgi:large subunit ribosomal protein L10|nr:50S ribosomal protein L10 [bacterium]NDE11581.1 50S ribosomal protein L10 [Chitinophagia bacterium]